MTKWAARLLAGLVLAATCGCGAESKETLNLPQKGVPPPLPGGMKSPEPGK